MTTGGIPEREEIDGLASSPVDGGVEPASQSSAEEQAPPSLRDTIEAAAAEARGQTDERPRDEHGRFLPKAEAGKSNPTSAPLESGQPKPASAPVTPQPAASEQPQSPSTAPASPPPGWSAEAKAEWTKLSPAIQAAVVKREQEVSTGFAKYAQRDRELEQIIGPRRQYYAAEGTSDTQAINNLWLWFEALRNTPAESFPALAQLFGYDLSTVASGAHGNPQPSDPLTPRLQTVEQRLEAIQRQTEQQNMQARQSELSAWANAKDAATGQPLRPHFEKVRVTMGRLMAGQFASTLDEAYEKAIKLTPEVAAEITASEKAAAERAQAEAALKARPAGQRRAAVSVRGSAPNGAAGTAAPTGIRESLKQGFAEARGG